MPDLPPQFFTKESMLTLTGASGATFIICNSLQKAFNFNPKWLALAVAEVICIYGALSSSHEIVVAIINGCLVFSTAAGATSLGPSPSVYRGSNAPNRRGFFSRWA